MNTRLTLQQGDINYEISVVVVIGYILVRVMVFKANFNNISAISWRSVLLMEETEVPGENHRPVTSH
jgi:hypothetical protein